MNDALGTPVLAENRRASVALTFARIVALLLLAAGLLQACRILGITTDGRTFSDLAPALRVAAATLLIMNLFAAVGLWIEAAWGPVMWAVALAVEVSMHTLFVEIFGPDPLRVALHALLFSVFLVLTFLEWRRAQAE